MLVESVSPEATATLWRNQEVMNGRAVEACKGRGIGVDGPGLPDISRSLIENICRHIMVPKKVWLRPMTKPSERLVTPDGDEIDEPFSAMTRRLGTRWCERDDEFAFRIGREITAEMFYDVLKAEDEETKKKPFRGLIYAPFVLIMLASISPFKMSGESQHQIGVMMRYSKRFM